MVDGCVGSEKCNIFMNMRIICLFMSFLLLFDASMYLFGYGSYTATLYSAYSEESRYGFHIEPSAPIWNISDSDNFTGCSISDYFGYGIIYNCSQYNSIYSTLRIVMVTLEIGNKYNKSIKELYSNNHKDYALIHGYIYIMINKSLINRTYSHQQKAYIFYHIITHIDNVDYILIMDLDILFLNCWMNIENVINYTSHINIYRNSSLDLIFCADFNGVNVGIILFKYSSWSVHFMYNWYTLVNNPDLYTFDNTEFIDQNSFSSLIFGFDVNEPIKSPIDWDPRFNFDNHPGPNHDENEIDEWYKRYLQNHNVSKNHVAIIPTIYLNNVWKQTKWWQSISMKYKPLPLLLHFAGTKRDFKREHKALTTSTCKDTVNQLIESNY